MEDRLMRGFIAGLIGALAQAVINLGAHWLGISQLSWYNFASVLIYGRASETLIEKVFGWVIAMGLSGVMGIFLAYLLPVVSSRYYLFKGWLFSIAIWFIFFAIPVLFQVPKLMVIGFPSAATNFVTTSIWGLITAELLRRFDKRSSEV